MFYPLQYLKCEQAIFILKWFKHYIITLQANVKIAFKQNPLFFPRGHMIRMSAVIWARQNKQRIKTLHIIKSNSLSKTQLEKEFCLQGINLKYRLLSAKPER